MSNGTESENDIWITPKCFTEERVYYSLLIVISFFIVCINIDVIYTMATNKSLQTKRNAFLLSLSVSDLLTGLVSIPLHITSNCRQPPSEVLILAQAICFRFIAISTMLNILMITIERYFGILYPIRYQFILTKARTSILITCTWATSISSALVSYSWLGSVSAGEDEIPMRERQFEKGYFIFSFLAFFLLPLIIMTVLYIRMFRAISKARKLASKSQKYSRTCDRSHSTIPRSPVEIRLTRPRSVTVGCYGDQHHRSLDHSPTMAQDRERRGDNLIVNGKFRSRSFSPGLMESMVSHNESNGQINVTVSPPQSPTWLLTTEKHRHKNDQIQYLEAKTANEERQTQSPYLSLPLNEATRYATHHGSYDRFLSSSHRFKSTNSLSTSTHSLDNMRGTNSKPLEKYLSDSVIASREKVEKSSLAMRLSDACEIAASKLRMFRQGSNEDRWGQAKIKREHRVLIVFVTMLSMFVLGWISWYIMVLDFTYSIYIPTVVLDCLDILRFSISFLNPILYTFFKKDFRVAFKKSLRRFSSNSDQQKSKSDFREKNKR
ncbi:octopamine receptor-like [Dendronephthya gigantea]|uniref:octopamine receptor-like n=1 Tax=Dendronephthya gigantea TaxID=151771 RepID=UPI001069377D|nr:octopamine receptor-like [Dendronephthya gigantea]